MAIKSWEKAIALDRYFAEAYHYISMAYDEPETVRQNLSRLWEYAKTTEEFNTSGRRMCGT
ncbi:hypothetical protein R83H12_02667 [Fibrobacteria bacterium R8-3-H12]